jgi:hypothetical protein
LLLPDDPPAVIADDVAYLDDPAQDARVFINLTADHEEGRLCVVLA